jgi:hypothetical protein
VTDPLDGLSNLTQLSANIEALKNARQNSAAALNSSQLSASGTTDVGSYLLTTEQNFSKMLDILTTPADQQQETSSSSDPFAFLNNGQDSTLSSLTSQQNALELQRLAAAEQNSALIGRTVAYYTSDSTAQQSGVVSKITFSGAGAVFLVLTDGKTIPLGSVAELK